MLSGWRQHLHEAVKNARAAIARQGSSVSCECCGNRSTFFLPFGNPPRRGAQCPHCGALERHRILWPYLRKAIGPEDRILHFAPEKIISQRLQQIPHRSYTAADLDAEASSSIIGCPVETADITNLPWPNGSFDKIIVSHVLEHVPDDMRALRELHRTLAPGGEVISQHPFEPERAETYEDFSIASREGRFKAFGQDDHVRIYGRDLLDRWRAAGFMIDVASDENLAGSTIIRATLPATLPGA